MAEPVPTDQDLYQTILENLRTAQAVEPAQQIDRTVVRGSITPREVEIVRGKKTEKRKIVATMSSWESLAVALEFLIAAAEVPLMVNRVRQILLCEAIEWRPDEPGPRAEELALKPISANVDLAELQRRIDSLVTIMKELNLDHPKIV